MKRLLLAVIAAAALVFAGQVYSADFHVPTRGGQILAMMGGGGGMMGGGHGYNGSGGHMGGGGYGGYGYDRDRNAPAYRYGDDHYRYDRYDDGNRYRRGERQELRDRLHRQRRELSEMIRSGDADPDAVDRKMYRIERLERQMDARRW